MRSVYNERNLHISVSLLYFYTINYYLTLLNLFIITNLNLRKWEPLN